MAKFRGAVVTVLGAHHFPPPQVLEDKGSLTYAVSARPKSDHDVELAVVERDQAGRVRVHLTAYHYGPSDWAVLGTLFSGRLMQEAVQMEPEIQAELGR